MTRRKIRRNRLVLLSVALLAAVGIFLLGRASITPSNTAGNAATGSTSTADTVSWEEAAYSKRNPVDDSPGCSTDFHYPVLIAGGAVSNDAAKTVNASIRAAVVAQVATLITDFDAGDTVEGAAQAFLDHCSRDLALYIDQAGDASVGWDAEITDAVSQNQDGIFSLALVFSWYMGGAHPNGSGTYLTFDVKTGKSLALADVIANDQVLAFEVKEKTALLADNADNLFPDDAAAFQAFVASPDVATADAFLSDHAAFSLSPDALTTHYDPYEIAPYAAGPIDVVIPRTELVGILSLP